MFTIQELRQQGCKVRVNHYRYYDRHNEPVNKYTAELLKLGNEFKQIKPRGGITRVEIDGMTDETLVGEAECSLEDNYNKRIGVKIALGRALKGK